MKKILIIALSILIVLSSITFFGFKTKADTLQVLFLYCDDEVHSYLNEYQHFQQSLVVNVEIEAKSCDKVDDHDLNDYDAIYLHQSLSQGKLADAKINSIESYVKKGGFIFVENELHTLFSEQLLGASSFQKLEQYPFEISLPTVNENVDGIQQIVELYTENINEYYKPQDFADVDLGVTMTPSTATSIVDVNGQSLYAINQFGKGNVIFLSNIFADEQFIESFDLIPKGQENETFNYMFATGSYLLKNELLSTLSKEKYGYSVSKVLGTNGRPAMAWQNHFEVLEAMKEGGMEKWIDLLKEYDQIPSFSLVREAYDWGVWKEGIVFHKNIGNSEAPSYQGENAHSQYSSGEMITLQDEPLALEQYPSKPSLLDKIELPYRAILDVGDVNKDGSLEIVSGSASGEVYLLSNQDRSKRNFNKQTQLLLTNGEPVKVANYAAPTLFDYNGDGLQDLIVGSENGKLYYFEQTKDSTFLSPKLLMSTPYANVVPTIGNFDEDDIEDLIIGNAEGTLHYYKGAKTNNAHSFSTNGRQLEDENGPINVGQYSAPKIADYDGNGSNDLLVGMNEGFVARYEWNNGKVINQGYLEGSTYNQFGDKRLWGGRNSVPAIADLDDDGKADLLVGHLIFGYAIPIDSDAFPYKEKLAASLQYAAENYINIQPHIFFHSYKSKEQEQTEIDLQKKSFEAYGLEWDRVGTNQHTWRINNQNYTQSFTTQMNNGIWWNSGFRPSNQTGEPSLSKYYLWTMPFLLADGEDTKNFVISNPAPNVPIFESVYPSYGKLDLPITHFFHIEYPVLTESGQKSLIYKAEVLDQIRDEYDYNFVTEDQMNKSYLAAYKTEAKISQNIFSSLWNTVRNQFFTKQQQTLSIKLDDDIDSEAKELMGVYKNSVGYKIDMGEKYKGYVFNTTAPIYSYHGTTLYVSDLDDVDLYLDTKIKEDAHIVRANLPVTVDMDNTNWTINWEDAGLQQIKIYAPNGLEVKDDTEWKLEQEDDYYVLTRNGDKGELTLTVN